MANKKISTVTTPIGAFDIDALTLQGHASDHFAEATEVIFNDNSPCTETIGGIAAGSTFDNVPVSTLLHRLLYKYYAPKITSLSINSSTNNNYYGGTTTVKSFTVNLDRGTVNPTFKSLTATFNGKSYTAANPAFTDKTYSYTFDVNPDETFTGTGSATHLVKPVSVTCVLNGAGENGESKTLTTSKNVDTWFNHSDYYYGGSLINNTKTGLSTITNKSGWGGDYARLVFSCSQNFPTIICPATWGNSIAVQDGARNPVNGVFSKVNTFNITNKNGYVESYNVFQSNTKASGSVAYLIKIS